MDFIATFITLAGVDLNQQIVSPKTSHNAAQHQVIIIILMPIVGRYAIIERAS
jgi:hypothetical protein